MARMNGPCRGRPAPRDHHAVEHFFQRNRRFRRIFLRCETTIPSCTGFVLLVSAPDGIG